MTAKSNIELLFFVCQVKCPSYVHAHSCMTIPGTCYFVSCCWELIQIESVTSTFIVSHVAPWIVYIL
jgi:hypothetical protein